MSYEDKTLVCVDCGQPFTFTADDQSYHAEKGYTNEPKRCTTCRQARRDRRPDDGFGGGGGGGGYFQGPREMHSVVCAECGKDATVPFRPRGDRPVYCSDCYSKQGGRSSAPRRY